ncbi:MAG: PhoH family protein [Neisseriaceae bacterium]
MKTVETLDFSNVKHRTLQRLCGSLDQNLRYIGEQLNLSIKRRLDHLTVTGKEAALGLQALQRLMEVAETKELDHQDIHLTLLTLGRQSSAQPAVLTRTSLKTQRGTIQAKTHNQETYINALLEHDIVFGLGPAGTGKTYLAVAAAVDAMNKRQVQKIILVRPAVEAGEKLGFLPGDLSQKIDPYLRPLYDALYEFMGPESVNKSLERGLIELAPLAYMRGRTLNNSFIILDEAQNTTKEQMKMFLTRIGFGSKTVITGDLGQIDLPSHIGSGLKDACERLSSIEGIYFHAFNAKDILRHPLVQAIVTAYEVSADPADS